MLLYWIPLAALFVVVVYQGLISPYRFIAHKVKY
jgi:hypothetical protein